MKAPRLLQGRRSPAGAVLRGKLPMAQVPQLFLGLFPLAAQLLPERCDLPRLRLLGADDQPTLRHTPILASDLTVAIALRGRRQHRRRLYALQQVAGVLDGFGHAADPTDGQERLQHPLRVEGAVSTAVGALGGLQLGDIGLDGLGEGGLVGTVAAAHFQPDRKKSSHPATPWLG
jgi:hypothetical protein